MAARPTSYLDVPGTIIFDAEQSRKGYWLNQFTA